MTEKEIAEEHARWLVKVFKELFDHMWPFVEDLAADVYLHGIKHGRELEKEEGGKKDPPPQNYTAS